MLQLLAASLLSSERERLMLRNIRLDHLYVGLSVCLSVRKVYCGKTADWIRMPFGVVSGVSRGDGYRQRGKGSFWVKLGRPIVTNGAFVVQLFRSACSDRAIVWDGEWGGCFWDFSAFAPPFV